MKTQIINADSDSSQKVEQLTYFKFYYEVSTSKVTDAQRKTVTRALEKKKMCWYETCFGPPYKLLLIESFISFSVL